LMQTGSRVSDFGLRKVDGVKNSDLRENAGGTLGNQAYIAPEQAECNQQLVLTSAADITACAILFLLSSLCRLAVLVGARDSLFLWSSISAAVGPVTQSLPFTAPPSPVEPRRSGDNRRSLLEARPLRRISIRRSAGRRSRNVGLRERDDSSSTLGCAAPVVRFHFVDE